MKPVRPFWSLVVEDVATGCWLWQGTMTSFGYGMHHQGGRSIRAHRFAYEDMIAPIPAGLVLDHLCRQKRCVNPYHLDPVPNGINVRRGESPSSVNRDKTHCIRGHAFDEENTHITSRGERECRACHREYMREWNRRRKAG